MQWYRHGLVMMTVLFSQDLSLGASLVSSLLGEGRGRMIEKSCFDMVFLGSSHR